MAIADTLLLAIFCFILGYQLGRNEQPTNNSPEAQWVGLELHNDSSDDSQSTQRPLDNLPPAALTWTAVAPRDPYGDPYLCCEDNCERYAIHPATRCPHLSCPGHHCLGHCHSLCCPYRPPRLYSDEARTATLEDEAPPSQAPPDLSQT